MPRCCVTGCESGSFKEINKTKAAGKRVKSFFTFPKNEELQKKWKKIIYNNEHEVVVKPKICEVHFKESDIVRFDDTILKDGTIHRMHRQRFLLRKGAIPILSNDEKSLTDAIVDYNSIHEDDDDYEDDDNQSNPIIVIQDEFMTKLPKNLENGLNLLSNQKDTVIVDLTNQPEMFQNNLNGLNLSLDPDVEIYSIKDLFQMNDMDEVQVETDKLTLPESENNLITNKPDKKSNYSLNSIVQEACETSENSIPNVKYQRDTHKKKYQNSFDSVNQDDYILTGDIPNYDKEMVKFPKQKSILNEKMDLDQLTHYNEVTEDLSYDFSQFKNDVQNKRLNISSSWAYTFNKDYTTVTFTYVHPIKLTIHLYCTVDSDMKVKTSPFDRKVSKESDFKFKSSSEFSEYLKKLEKTKCCDGTGVRNIYSKRCLGFITFDDEYKRPRGYQRCSFCRELRKRTLSREDNFFNIELRMREQNCKIRTLQYKYSQLQKFLIRKEKIWLRKRICD